MKEYLTYIQSFGIITGFLITAFTTWRSLRVSRVSAYIDLVKSHRDIWSLPIKEEGLDEILSMDDDNWRRKISDTEIAFIGFLINHISCSFELLKIGNLISPEGFSSDVKNIFSRPIPRRVWEETKRFRNKDFVEFIDGVIVDKKHFKSI